MEANTSTSNLLEKLDKAENLLFLLMSDVEKVLRLISKNLTFAVQQIDAIEAEPEENEIIEMSTQAFKKINELGQKLKEITKDLPLEIPRQTKTDNLKRFQCENLALVLENYMNDINGLIDKEKSKFPNTFQFNNNILDT